jgi:hypothetical protein
VNGKRGPPFRRSPCLPFTVYGLPFSMSAEPPPITTTVTWRPTGPYVIEGPIVVRDNEGSQLVPPPTKVPGQVKLCGCGLSKTKPFCDGSHKR